ncbi:MAG TPA: aquaporin family protein [Clostridiales bacterium UBA8153]|nr:aquaporin family protein [Clostridiales bacterium UBA8153]
MVQQALAETIGTALLLSAVVGSGIMAERLAGGHEGLALLANALATAAALAALILAFGPVSGGHFNPAVTLFMALRGELAWVRALPYVLAQLTGGVLGVWVAHLMFDIGILARGLQERSSAGLWAGEIVATAGLLFTIWATARERPGAVPWAVASWILAACWFTSSTAFANPAATIARSLTPTFAGIAWRSAPAFIGAQVVGVGLAVALAAALTPAPRPRP